jgi:hypothetical protein
MAAPVLRSLWLNCLLAGLVPALVASSIATGAWTILVARIAADRDGEALAALETWARQGALGRAVEPSAWREADPRWSGLAVVRWEGDALVVSASAGVIALDPAVPPAWLPAAVQQPRSERRGALLVAATPVLDADGAATALAWGETPAPRLPAVSWLVGLLAAIVAAGGGMAWYLARRISGPVAEIQRVAAAAAAGLDAPGVRETSIETAPLRRAVEDLVERSRSGRSP